MSLDVSVKIRIACLENPSGKVEVIWCGLEVRIKNV